MTRDELRRNVYAALLYSGEGTGTTADAVMAEVDRYLAEFTADAEAEFAARLPEAIEAHVRATGDPLGLPPPGRFKSFSSPRWSDENNIWYDGGG